MKKKNIYFNKVIIVRIVCKNLIDNDDEKVRSLSRNW